MTVQLNHTIVAARDSEASARWLTDMLGLPAPAQYSHFQVVELDNGVSLDYLATTDPIHPRHYAFMVDESEFDEIFGRIQEQGNPYWADPGRERAGEINHRDDGRGVYFEDPDGHLMEILTRPYGSGS